MLSVQDSVPRQTNFSQKASSVDRQELTAVESSNLKAQCSCKSTSDSTCTDYLLQLGLRGSTAFYSLSLPCFVITCASTSQQLDPSKEAARSTSSQNGAWCLVLRYNYTVEPHSWQKNQQEQLINTQDRPERFFLQSSYSGRLNLWRLLLSDVWQRRMKGPCSVFPDKGPCISIWWADPGLYPSLKVCPPPAGRCGS